LKPTSPNQDDFCITFENDVLVLGVFDGHGKFGHDCSNYVHTFLPTAIIADPRFENDPETACRRSF
jgi:serine/threonine protein phosphatase PrpC